MAEAGALWAVNITKCGRTGNSSVCVGVGKPVSPDYIPGAVEVKN